MRNNLCRLASIFLTECYRGRISSRTCAFPVAFRQLLLTCPRGLYIFPGAGLERSSRRSPRARALLPKIGLRGRNRTDGASSWCVKLVEEEKSNVNKLNARMLLGLILRCNKTQDENGARQARRGKKTKRGRIVERNTESADNAAAVTSLIRSRTVELYQEEREENTAACVSPIIHYY